MNVYIHKILQHLQSMDIIIHCLHTVQKLLNKNIYWHLHKAHYTENKFEKLYIGCRKFMTDYIQKFLRRMHTGSSECRTRSALNGCRGPFSVLHSRYKNVLAITQHFGMITVRGCPKIVNLYCFWKSLHFGMYSIFFYRHSLRSCKRYGCMVSWCRVFRMRFQAFLVI